jgi:hypothetical protein
MPINASVEVYGVKEVLKELGEVDKKAKLKAISKVKAAGAPAVSKARENYPSNPVLVNKKGNPSWGANGRLGYSKSAADKGVSIQIGGRARGEAFPIVTIVQKNAGAAMFDIAGFANGSTGKGGARGEAFIKKLEKEYGKAQRGMWRNVKEIRELANNAILKAIDEVAQEVNRKILR